MPSGCVGVLQRRVSAIPTSRICCAISSARRAWYGTGSGAPTSIRMPSPAKSRSEEHTSELQSLMRNSYAVFCLKKKKTQKNKHQQPTHNHKHNKPTHQQKKEI